MTLLQIIKRIKSLASAHKQIRRFKTGLAADLFADHTAKYPACCLQYGAASLADGALTINFRMFVLDLVNVAEETKENENDVLSDTLQILMDLYAEMNSSNYDDWRISASGSMEAIVEGGDDMYAGWYIDFTIRTPFTQNICAVPTEEIDFTPIDNEMKLVYDIKFVATEVNNTITLPELLGKKILLVTQESSVKYKVSSNPVGGEFTWNDVTITLGTAYAIGHRFLILYRDY